MSDAATASAILPVFVLGLQRSGTTWLANLISSHADMTSIGSADHQGIHESIFFSHFARSYGDLEDQQNYSRFMRDFCCSDYYVLSGLPPGWLHDRHPANYADAFQWLMDEVARRRGARGWVEKSPHHTLLGDELSRIYPKARFVCVIRDYLDMIRSRLWAYGREPLPYPERIYQIARACAVNSLYERYLRRFCRDNKRALLVFYQDLKSSKTSEINRVFDFLGLDRVGDDFSTEYAANSSFVSPAQKEQGLTGVDRFFIHVFKWLIKWAPYSILVRLESGARNKGVDWPDWCWKINPRPE